MMEDGEESFVRAGILGLGSQDYIYWIVRWIARTKKWIVRWIAKIEWIVIIEKGKINSLQNSTVIRLTNGITMFPVPGGSP